VSYFSGDLSHRMTWAGCIVSLTTATSSLFNAPRLVSWYSLAEASRVFAASYRVPVGEPLDLLALCPPRALQPLTAYRWFIEYWGRLATGWVNDLTRPQPKTPVA
jgi:hypothetical protein